MASFSRPLAHTTGLLLVLLLGSDTTPASTYVPRHTRDTVQDLVNELKARLSIVEDVDVAIVSENHRLLSVEPLRDRRHGFVLSLDQAFLELLDRHELEAAIAHELGHVWIFTNHPYLHTERLANRIALRVVSRGSLVQVYEKMWERTGLRGDLARLIDDDHGPGPSQAATRAPHATASLTGD
jgi:hypothetical protein